MAKAGQKHKGPKGTRDLYSEGVLRQRYITGAWRDVSIRHGFEEIAGPTFEHASLYAVKSGEAILGELFQAFSGKSPDEVEAVRETGRAPYALRPEFTPTLARMYAAHAQQLPQPCKWFTAGSYFRAERPQRGRLREFLQWNIDMLADDGTEDGRARADAEVLGTAIELCRFLGLRGDDYAAKISHRGAVAAWLSDRGIEEGNHEAVMGLLDAAGKLPVETIEKRLGQLGIDPKFAGYMKAGMPPVVKVGPAGSEKIAVFKQVTPLWKTLIVQGLIGQVEFDLSVVRGLAYYTGTVFELVAEGERAICGGGRYDSLIELFGGPETPAVGFGMGDVVLGLLLDEKGLIPEGDELADAVSRAPASVRPEVFCLSADDEKSDPYVMRLVTDLRRGIESAEHGEDARPWSPGRYEDRAGGVRPMHARPSYKSTRNLKKLLADAQKQGSRLVAVVHGKDRVELRDLDRRTQLTPEDIPGMPSSEAEFSVNPQSPVYVGRAAVRVLGHAHA
jgi:histidyl-tRNA synthetase